MVDGFRQKKLKKKKFGLKIEKSVETFYSFSKIYQILGSKLACIIHCEVWYCT
jgi:hypothetical protein